jgi:hypothetical protein
MDPLGSPALGALHNYLAEMAEEVTLVDLRDRVRASSRRATVRRRAVLASSAAVVAVAVVSGAAWAGLPRSPDNGVTPVAPGSPAPSVAPSVSSTPSKSAPTTTTPVTVPERLFYLALSGKLQRLDGSSSVEVFVPRTPSCGLIVSPDRTRIAYVVADGGGATGDLIVARPDGSGQKTVSGGVACTGGESPVWQPGSRKILLRQGNRGPRVVVDVATRKVGVTPLRDVPGYVAWSPNGAYVAYAEDGKIVVARPDGTVVHRVAHADESPAGGFSVQGVSDDGGRVVVGLQNTDPDIIRTGFRLVDATNGRDVDLPPDIAPGDRLRAAIYPAPGNRLLVRVEDGAVHKLYMVGPDGKVLDSRTEPADLRTATLLTSS